jgi:hypothetical protein
MFRRFRQDSKSECYRRRQPSSRLLNQVEPMGGGDGYQTDLGPVAIWPLARGYYIFFCESEPLNLTLDRLKFDTRTQDEDDVPRLQLRAQFIKSRRNRWFVFGKIYEVSRGLTGGKLSPYGSRPGKNDKDSVRIGVKRDQFIQAHHAHPLVQSGCVA